MPVEEKRRKHVREHDHNSDCYVGVNSIGVYIFETGGTMLVNELMHIVYEN